MSFITNLADARLLVSLICTTYFLMLSLVVLSLYYLQGRSTLDPRLACWSRLLLSHGTKTLSPDLNRSPQGSTWKHMWHLRISKARYFQHFYVIGLLAMLVLLMHDTWRAATHVSSGYAMLTLLFVMHLTRRWIETAMLFPYSSHSSMHVGHLLLGVSYYPMLSIALHGLAIDVAYWPAQLTGLRLIVFGLLVALFLGLMAGQHICHSTLYYARKGASHRHYVLPHFFSILNALYCPHYFLEICLYVCLGGMAILVVRQPFSVTMLPLLANAIWVLIGLSVSALASKRYYETEAVANQAVKGSSSMPQRKAILPYLL